MKTQLKAWLHVHAPFIYALAGILFLDRATKVWALLRLVQRPVELCPFLHLRYVENTGMAFGLFQNGNRFLIVVMGAIIAYILYSWKELSSYGKVVQWGSVFILAGALGNLYDRITLGFVVDFLDFRVWPVFNVADSFITIGAGLFIVAFLTKRPEEKK